MSPFWIEQSPVVKFAEKKFDGLICLLPFTTIEIDINGGVRLCECSAWMPSIVGNLFEHSLQDILSNNLSQSIRRSISQGTYEYCNENTCGVINGRQLVTSKVLSPVHKTCIDDPSKFLMPTVVRIAGDLTCNLSCPSCRQTVIKSSDSDIVNQEQLGLLLQKNLFNQPTDQHMILHVSTSGEIFASPRLIRFVNSIPIDHFPNLVLHVQTNGLLMPKRWHHLGAMCERTKMITITTDAAEAKTYEKLRRGGKWSDIQEALTWVSNHKIQTGVRLSMRMVVQKDNYEEIESFYYQAKSVGADVVEYSRLLDWGTFTTPEFARNDVFDQSHPQFHHAQRCLEKVKKHADVFLCGGIT